MTIPFQRFQSNRLILVFFLVAVYFLVLLNVAGDLYATHVEPLDLQFAYSPDKAYHILGSYTPQTRKFYILSEITLDLVYPMAYTIFLSFSILALYPQRQNFALLPYIIFIFDMCENIGIVAMLTFYPIRINTVAWITSTFTTVKWLISILCFGFLVAGLFNKFYKKISSAKQEKSLTGS